MDDDNPYEVRLEPPNIVVEVNFTDREHLGLTAEYDIAEVLGFESEDVEIIDTHWHGMVVEGPEETHHVDLRDLQETEL